MKIIWLTICSIFVILGAVLLVVLMRKDSVTLPASSASSPESSANAPEESRSQPNEVSTSSAKPLNLPLASPKIVIKKGKRQLLLYSGTKLLRTYRAGLGFNPVPDKVQEGDGATPEGEFYIFTKNENSNYYLSLGISYPNRDDAKRGLRDGLITEVQHQQIMNALRNRETPPQDTALGGQIYIHGRGSHKDWTWGCIALDDRDIEELFSAVPKGTRVIIKH